MTLFSFSEVDSIATLRQVMNGNVGPLLRTLFDQGEQYRSRAGREAEGNGDGSNVSLVSLASVAHLAYLLVLGADQSDLAAPTKSGKDADSSYLELIARDLATRLNAELFPAQMVVSYLDLCPVAGFALGADLLSERNIATDQEAEEIAGLLHSLGHAYEAEKMLTERAEYWLQSCHPLYQGDDYVRSLLSPHSDVTADNLTPESRHISTAAKALYFLQLASHFSRVEALLERSLYRCMAAVSRCSPLFAGFNFVPMAPVPRSSSSDGDRYEPSVPEKKQVRTFTTAEGNF